MSISYQLNKMFQPEYLAKEVFFAGDDYSDAEYVPCGRGRFYADYVIIKDGWFWGFEYKWIRDTKWQHARGLWQLSPYSRWFNYVSYIVTDIDRKKAVQILPKWVGIYIYGGSGLERQRKPTFQRRIKREDLIHALSKEYLADCVALLGVNTRGLKRRELLDFAMKSRQLTAVQLRQIVADQWRDRYPSLVE